MNKYQKIKFHNAQIGTKFIITNKQTKNTLILTKTTPTTCKDNQNNTYIMADTTQTIKNNYIISKINYDKIN